MLLKFAIENWMSFHDRNEISMIATREQQHGETVAEFSRVQTRILPMGVLFGGNASGKSNFFLALSFVKGFVVNSFMYPPDAPIFVNTFALDEESRNKPSRFEITFLAGDDIYEYSFVVDRRMVHEESLNRITSPAKGFSYARVTNPETGETTLKLGKAFADDKPIYEMILKTTRPNRLFLSAAIMQNATVLTPVYNWFARTLQMISPTSRYEALERYADASWIGSERMNSMLSEFDTGIAKISRIPVERAQIPVPQPILDGIERKVPDGKSIRIFLEARALPYMVTRKDGRYIYEKIVAQHHAPRLPGGVSEFEIEHESDGTKRILEILPAFAELELQDEPRVVVIDEIDRCLHAMATRRMIRFFRDSRTVESRSQLLATTHAISLLDQELLRRDEMWLVERDHESESSRIYSVAEFSEARKDKDLARSYLAGRMGGIPSIDAFTS